MGFVVTPVFSCDPRHCLSRLQGCGYVVTALLVLRGDDNSCIQPGTSHLGSSPRGAEHLHVLLHLRRCRLPSRPELPPRQGAAPASRPCLLCALLDMVSTGTTALKEVLVDNVGHVHKVRYEALLRSSSFIDLKLSGGGAYHLGRNAEAFIDRRFCLQVGKPEAAQSLGKQLMTTGFSIGIFNSVLAGDCYLPFLVNSAAVILLITIPVCLTAQGTVLHA